MLFDAAVSFISSPESGLFVLEALYLARKSRIAVCNA